MTDHTTLTEERTMDETLIVEDTARDDTAHQDVDGYARQVNVLARWGDSDAEVAAAQHEQDRLIDHAGYELDKYGDIRRAAK